MRGALALSAAFAAVLSSGCFFGDDNRNHRLAIWDSETGAWEIVSPSGRSTFVPAWLPDSSGLLVIEGEPQGTGPVQPGGYFITVRGLDGDVRWEVEGDMADRQPVAAAGSPDGKEVAVLRDTFGQQERRAFIEIRDAANGDVLRTAAEWVTQLTEGFTPIAADVVWTSDGRLAVVSHRGGGSNDLLWFDGASLEPEAERPTEPSEVFAVGSPHGTAVAVFAVAPPGLMLHRPSEEPLPVAVRSGNIAVAFGPDGRRFVMADGETITIVDAETGETTDIREAQTQGISWGASGRIAIAWDGKVMTFEEDGSGLETVVDLSGGRTARNPAWSPDGRYLAFIVEPRYRD